MHRFAISSLAAVAALATSGGLHAAGAADVSTPVYKAPVIPVVEEQSPWQIRVRALYVMPTDSGSVDQIPGSDLDYSDAVVPELDITYYFTKNWAAELILAVTPHDISGAGTIDALGKVGEVWLLPPTLTLQYHFTDFGAFKPYVGAGVNYTFFFDQSAKGAATDIDVKGAWGFALQAGFDYMIDEHWGFNVDVKKIFLEPDFDIDVAGAALNGKADLNPWLIGVGVTYRF
ncbi:OmpW family protein [Ancylobacter sp. A5.8]|uniref:OmpW/AlkL family protein n=1 Tax=Ancylobacter gelatini TaxID=2919920 RepID=UPI001F4D9280|nr:OmpW family protein [Ancylobacter gelatini]MCJ8144863.1 OmpW family protein [Ancylobacter gelatini]